MDWDKLRIFHAVAEAGSFTHAGETLNLSQSAVSRQIGALEDELSVPLFQRHARGLILTEQGELLFRTAHDVFGKLAIAEAMLMDSREKPHGELRVTATVGMGTFWLAPRIHEFIEIYPDIELNLILTESELDLTRREADIALRLHPPSQPDLIQRRLMTVHYHIYASPNYLLKRGSPKVVEDLDNHALVVYGEGIPYPLKDVNWIVTVGRPNGHPRQSVLRMNNIYGVLRAVESGAGIAALPDYIVQDNTSVVRIMPELEGPTFETYFVYPDTHRKSKRVAVFRDFLLQKARGWTF
jgi:DNA-binding transcriptional LysR family regulator